ncbi:MAG: FAD-dependent oxidoreductase [Candidatus Limnocylindrales bacterium]
MIVDGAPGGTPIRCDVAIVGGGPAGIALALRLARAPGVTVAVLESGGLTFEEPTQDLARAETVGTPYYAMHETRIRALGGSSWSWGGVCTPLDALAFESRPWVAHGSWPFPQAALEPYLEDALALCGISREDRRHVDEATTAAARAAGLDARCVAAVPIYFSRPMRFGAAYREQLAALPNVTVHLHSTVTRLERQGGQISGLHAIARGEPIDVQAQAYVLAGGGIENPRLLLVSGIDGDPVGRFFMEHLRVVNRYAVRPGDTPLGRLIGGGAAGTLRFCRLTIADETQRQEHLLNWHANLQFGYAGQRSRQWPAVRRLAIATRAPWNESPYFQDAGGGRVRVRGGDIALALRRPDLALLGAYGALTERPSLRRFLEVWSALEQVPERHNRVALTDQVDGLGVPRVRIHWTAGATEERTYRRSLEILLAQLERLEPGISGAALDEPDPWPAQLVGNWHHEGTTRMDDDPQRGVVDRDCRVHGVTNLFVAGSSVFPVSGSTSPTVTILQLALRLGDHHAPGLAAEQAAATVGGAALGAPALAAPSVPSHGAGGY